jgi:starch-binding outer membrane protein, SusD/RagB family
MKISKLITYYLIYSIILFTGFSSCKKFASIPPPMTQVETNRIFENDQAAIAATVGLYSQMMQASFTFTNAAITIYPALSADELYNTSANADYDLFHTNDILSPANGLTRLWTFAYRDIYQANAVMEGLNNSLTLGDSLKKQLRGEMLVVRALSYFYLVNLFGDIPVVTTTSYLDNQSLPRSPVADVYQSIVTDLQEAKSLLQENYPSAGRARPNKWTAAALLARVYLYMKNWPQAETEASAVISSGIYSLVPNLNNVFLVSSTEAIWQMSPVTTSINTAEGNLFIPIFSFFKPTFAATDSLLNAFEANDQRKTSWLSSSVISGKTYYYPFKYKVRTGGPPYTEYYMVLRLAELYLIRAEARAQQNNITPAQDDLNKIRNRAGLPNTIAGTQALLLNAIQQERRIELFAEWGHRWFDLKRSGNINNVLQPVKAPHWQPSDALYPLPQYDLQTNPFLVQNPGY